MSQTERTVENKRSSETSSRSLCGDHGGIRRGSLSKKDGQVLWLFGSEFADHVNLKISIPLKHIL